MLEKIAAGNNRLPELAAAIRAAHSGVEGAARTAAERAIEAGHALIEAKELVSHGGWLRWLKEHCRLSERSAQLYMKLARSGLKSETVADVGLRKALAMAAAKSRTRYAPLAGHLRIGEHTADRGTNTVIIAPSYQHSGFCYVTRLWQDTKNGGGDILGSRRPVRADYLEAVVRAHITLAGVVDEMIWTDVKGQAWAFNRCLFDTPDHYVDSLHPHDGEDRAEIQSLMKSEPPIDGLGMQIRIRAASGDSLAAQ